jgi:ERCC4-type nuclease
MLMCVDGIGEKKARTVLDKIPLDKLWDSSIEDIQSVKGIGPKQATAIKKVFTRRSDESETNQRRIKELSK